MLGVWIEPVTLEGRYVRLEPANDGHIDALWQVAQDPEIWTYIPFPVRTRDELASLVEFGNASGLSFATIDRVTGEPVGGTAFLALDPVNRSVEIGATWITPEHQRTSVNTDAKLLQLTHAFETLECERVYFKTDSRNVRSRAAIARLGATEEGTFRRHWLLPDGTWRDSVYFSVIAPEWPAVRANLTERLDR